MKLSSLKDEDMAVFHTCSPSERVTMPVSYDHTSPYSYFYLPFIKDMGFSSFPLFPWRFRFRGFLTSRPSSYSLRFGVLSFEMVYEDLEITPTVEV